MKTAIGRHLLADFHGCPPQRLSDPAQVEQALRQAAQAAGATVLAGHVHHFGEAQGVTGILLLMESHLSIHTWPEHGYAALDLFMCGQASIDAALARLREALQPAEVHSQLHRRGELAASPIPDIANSNTREQA